MIKLLEIEAFCDAVANKYGGGVCGFVHLIKACHFVVPIGQFEIFFLARIGVLVLGATGQYKAS
jgi:hypothetical protein